MTTAGAQGVRVSPKHRGEGSTPSRPASISSRPGTGAVLPHVGGTTVADAETSRNGGHGKGPARKFDHDKAFYEWCTGTPMRTLVRRYGVHRSALEQAFQKIRRDAARSPIPCPAPDDPPPVRVDGGDASAGGLRGAPAGDSPSPARDEKEMTPVEVGAPIVRRQLDEHGDTIYVFDLPAARYQTHSHSLVLEMLQPFEPSSVRWINEED